MHATEQIDANGQALLARLRAVSVPARKLFCVILREAFHGPMSPKVRGTSVPAEILEACGLDVGDFYGLLDELTDGGLIRVSGLYPFEEISLSKDAAAAEAIAEQCRAKNVPLENVLASPGHSD